MKTNQPLENRRPDMMSHERISHSKKTQRFNLNMWVRDLRYHRVRLAVAIETTNYGTGETFCVIDSEGLFFTIVIQTDSWGKEFYDAVKDALGLAYQREQVQWLKSSGDPVIPEQKLSTGICNE